MVKKKIVNYTDFEVVGKYHYPFTDDSLAFVTCDREAACSNACKDTFPTDSRKGTCFTLTCHTSYVHTSWPAGSYCPLLWAVLGLVPLAFLLSRTSQCWLKVYCAGSWIVIQPWLSPFSLLGQTFASAGFHLLSTWKTKVLDLAVFSLTSIPDRIINRSGFHQEYWIRHWHPISFPCSYYYSFVKP